MPRLPGRLSLQGKAMRIDTMPAPRTDVDWDAITAQLRRIATGLTHSAEEAEDLVQHTLTRLLSRAPEKASHLGYARTTLLRRWLDLGRRRTRRRRGLRGFALTLPRWSESPTTDDRAVRIREAVDALPPKQRAVLVLRVVAELEYTSIAEAMDCSVEAVRANLHLARSAVRTRLGDMP
ncbi:MAG: sigma-70 family RNA polymerase sigma factor [Planctomycetota bacterium]